MRRRYTLFNKIIIILLLIIIPVTIMYGYSYYTSVKVIEHELKNRNLDRLFIVRNQIDANFDKLSTLLLALSSDTSMNQFKNIDIYNDYETFKIKSYILEKMAAYTGLSTWSNHFSVYSTRSKQVLNTGERKVFPKELAMDWQYKPKEHLFIKHMVQPINSYNRGEPSELIVEASFTDKNIKTFLEQLKQNGYGDPFIYSPSKGSIVSSSSNQGLINKITNNFANRLKGDSGSITVEIGGDQFLVSYVKSETLNWMLVDYTLLQDILFPLNLNRNLFYISVVVLLLLSMLAAFLLYRNVQLPIRNLINAIHLVKEGNYAARVKPIQNNEFHFMIASFNEMAEQIETLIEEVYKEKIRYQDAHVKQLQSQINPHFLYNSLFILKNMAKLNQYEAVEAMTVHLGKYYRYVTRVENECSTIREELDFVQNYLEILVLRMQGLRYSIDVPDEMLDVSIPRLLIQPIVENAFVHGLDSMVKDGRIHIKGVAINGGFSIAIEDNGRGLSQQRIKDLREKISLPMGKETGCGVWNVHQRLVCQFGAGSGLTFGNSNLGGLCVTLHWKHEEIEKGATNNVSFVNCG